MTCNRGCCLRPEIESELSNRFTAALELELLAQKYYRLAHQAEQIAHRDLQYRPICEQKAGTARATFLKCQNYCPLYEGWGGIDCCLRLLFLAFVSDPPFVILSTVPIFHFGVLLIFTTLKIHLRRSNSNKSITGDYSCELQFSAQTHLFIR